MRETQARRVAITGGSGFVGTNLVSHFIAQGWDVLSLDVAVPRHRGHLPYWREIDLLDRSRLVRELCSFQPSVVLHFGARTDLSESDALRGYAANIEGVSNIIEAIRSTPSVERVIFASSQLVCQLGYSPVDERDYQPNTRYGESKMIGEQIVRATDEIGATWSIVRPTSLWGPWFDVPYKDFFLAIARGIYMHPGEARTLKQWGFVGNAVFQVWRLIQAAPSSVHKRTFYVADYEPVELREFATQVQGALQARPIRTAPRSMLRLTARAGDIAHGIGWKTVPLTTFRYRNLIAPELQDLRPMARVVGPLPYTVEQGIEVTVNWLRGQRDATHLSVALVEETEAELVQ